MPYTHTASASTRHTRPRPAISSVVLLLAWRSGLELRRALRDQGVPFAHIAPAPALDRDDYLAPFAEGVGHRARIGHRDGGAAGAVLDVEIQRGAFAMHGPGHHRTRQLIGASGLDLANELAGTQCGTRGAEARVHKRTRQYLCRRQRHNEARRSLASGVHLSQVSQTAFEPGLARRGPHGRR